VTELRFLLGKRALSNYSNLVLTALVLVGASCSLVPEDQKTSPALSEVQAALTETPTDVDSAMSRPSENRSSTGFTYHQSDGNRFAAGRGHLSQAEPIDIELSGQPVWLVAAPSEEGSIWVAMLDGGKAEAFHLLGEKVQPIPIEPSGLPPAMPPMLILENGVPMLLTAGEGAASELTHAVRLDTSSGSAAYLIRSGNLVIEESDTSIQIAAGALPDARLLLDETGRLLMLTDPTTQYGHGVLGDGVEARSVTLVDTSPSPQISVKLETQGERVIEGISPIWADLDGDGAREIIVTESDSNQGAQIVVYDEQGNRIAVGPAIGQGFRWRHQLAVAPFGLSGEQELAAVLTPHIGGVVEFYQLRGDQLEIVAQVPGYSSHLLGSRNLDRALAGDFDGDGRVELLVPDQAQNILGAIRRNPDGAAAAWTIPLDGKLATNLAAATLASGEIVLGVGREDGVLRIWMQIGEG
jgi:hypothetical protein